MWDLLECCVADLSLLDVEWRRAVSSKSSESQDGDGDGNGDGDACWGSSVPDWCSEIPCHSCAMSSSSEKVSQHPGIRWAASSRLWRVTTRPPWCRQDATMEEEVERLGWGLGAKRVWEASWFKNTKLRSLGVRTTLFIQDTPWPHQPQLVGSVLVIGQQSATTSR